MTTRELLNGFTREEGIALLNEKKSDKEIYDLFISKGLTDDFETFKKEIENLTALMTAGNELTDEQLEMVAGGDGKPPTVGGPLDGSDEAEQRNKKYV